MAMLVYRVSSYNLLLTSNGTSYSTRSKARVPGTRGAKEGKFQGTAASLATRFEKNGRCNSQEIAKYQKTCTCLYNIKVLCNI